MFCQVTAERILASFPFGLLLVPLVLHVAPVSGPDGQHSQFPDPYDLREGWDGGSESRRRNPVTQLPDVCIRSL